MCTRFTLHTIAGTSLLNHKQGLLCPSTCMVECLSGCKYSWYLCRKGKLSYGTLPVFVRVNFSLIPVSVAYLWQAGFKRHNWNHFQSLKGDKMRQNSPQNDRVLKVKLTEEDMQPVSFLFLLLVIR